MCIRDSDEDAHVFIHPQQHVKDQAHSFHLGAHHPGAADKGEDAGQQAGGAAVALTDDAAHGAKMCIRDRACTAGTNPPAGKDGGDISSALIVPAPPFILHAWEAAAICCCNRCGNSIVSTFGSGEARAPNASRR